MKKPELSQTSIKMTQLVIIDTQVEDVEKLLKGVIPSTTIILLDSTKDGVQQITQTLQKYTNLSEVHLISHGSPGCLQLGNTQLSLDTLNLYANSLQSWSVDTLMLYGCNVAAGDAGIEFIDKLHQFTGAKIAASANKTGYSGLGGDWNLEVKTDKFEVSSPLTLEVRENYRFAFPIPIENLTVERRLPNDDEGDISYIAPDIRTTVPEGTEIEYNFQEGDGNLLEVTSFTSGQDQFLAGDVLNDFELRRTDNENVQGRRQLLWFERESQTSEELNLRSPFPRTFTEDPDDSLMEVALFDDIINLGTDNIFANTSILDDQNINNIERVDYISTDGLQAPQENLNEVGFLILERGGNDAFKISPILDVNAQGLPTEFGDLIEIGADEWGVDESITLDTSVLRSDNYPEEQLQRRINVDGQNIGGIYISFEDLGIEASEQFNGYALFAPDVDETTNLVDFESFPTNTPELPDVGAGGGLDLIAGGVVYGRIFININDVTVTEGEQAQFTVSIPSPLDTPLTVNYSTSDTDLNPNEPNQPTATAGEDYTPITEGSFTIPAGETEVTVNVETLADNEIEENEQFRVMLSDPSRGFIIDREGIGTIIDNTEDTPPVTEPDTTDTPADTNVSLNILDNDTDAVGNIDPTTVDLNPNTPEQETTRTIPGQGTYTVDDTGVVTFDPEAGFSGTSTINYTVQDDAGNTSEPTEISVIVEPRANLAPNAVNDSDTTAFETPVTLNVLENDTDPEDDPLTIVDIQQETSNGGTVRIENGQLVYTPADGFSGEDEFTYTVSDGEDSDRATVSVTVEPSTNVPPTTVPDQGVTTEGEPVSLNVLENDTDSEGNIDPTTVDLNPDTPEQETTREIPGVGTYSVDDNGVVTFEPVPGFTGDSTINYTVEDEEGQPSEPAAINVTVNPPANVPPTTVPDQGVTTAGEPVSLNVLENDTDSEGNIDPTTVDLNPDTPEQETTREVPGVGTYSVDDDGVVTFEPEPGFTGDSTLDYTVKDNEGQPSEPAAINVTVNPPANVPPTTVPDQGVTTAGEPVSLNVLENDTDPVCNIDPTTVDLNPDTPAQETTREVPGVGTYSVDDTGVVTFEPEPGFTGDSTINYTVEDEEGQPSEPAAINVTVNPPANVPPTATNENANTPFETAATFNLADNVSDPDGNIELSSIDLDPSTPELDQQVVLPAGTFTVNDQAEATFDPVDDFSGTVTLPYTVADDLGATSQPANLSVTVSPDANEPPTAEDVQASSILNNSNPIPLPLSTANFSDPDGIVELINFTLPDPTQGILLQDGVAVTNPIQVQRLTPNQLDNLSFRPSLGFAGNASFNYRVTDDDGATSNAANVTVPIIPFTVPNVPPVQPEPPIQPEPPTEPPTEPSENLSPEANNETETIINDGTPSVIPTLSATDPDGSIDFYTITDLPPNGTLLIDGEAATSEQVEQLTPEQSEQLTFEPDPDFTGDVSLTYTATDNDGAVSNQAVVQINVEEDQSIPRGEPIDDGGCDCPPLPDFGAVPLPDRLGLTPQLASESNIIRGTEQSDTLPGTPTSDVVLTFGGDDMVAAFNGSDTVFGGVDNDLYFGDDGNDYLLGSDGRDTIISSNGVGDLAAAANSENNDSVYGHQSNDLLQGGPGSDMMFGGKQDDFTYGGKNSDLVWGDLGTDTLYGDLGNDTMIGDTADENNIEAERGLPGMIDFMWGGAGDDLMNGGRSNDTLSGGVGNDTVRGGKEDDLVYGEAGDDEMYGDLGNDQLCGNEGNDTVYGDINDNDTPSDIPGRDTLCGGIGNDILFGNEDQDRLCGGEDSDTLYGGLGEDILAGEQGDDWLFGDQGNDLISGGSGVDRFILFSGSGTDTIQDFQLGTDLIALGGGLTFEQLTLSQSGTSTVVSLEGQQLAILNDVSVSALTEDNFTAFVG
ncbi:MAG: Ig-like domain-containing protein [Limnoraphis sp.]